jgi:hypothetical protein
MNGLATAKEDVSRNRKTCHAKTGDVPASVRLDEAIAFLAVLGACSVSSGAPRRILSRLLLPNLDDAYQQALLLNRYQWRQEPGRRPIGTLLQLPSLPLSSRTSLRAFQAAWSSEQRTIPRETAVRMQGSVPTQQYLRTTKVAGPYGDGRPRDRTRRRLDDDCVTTAPSR